MLRSRGARESLGWVFEPIEYSSIDRLIETMDAEIIDPAERRFDELVVRRAEVLKVRRV
jgi:hypothetical protein